MTLFKKVDKNISIDNEEKFLYLIQPTVLKSRTRDVVESFPPTKHNQPIVVHALKTMLGKDDLLIKVHVRKFVSFVLQTHLMSTRMLFNTLYNKLECYIR